MTNVEWRSERGHPAPAIAAVAVIVKDGKLLLLRDPSDGSVWRLPESFVRLQEPVAQACERVVPVQIGAARARRLVGVWSDPVRDPRGHVVAIAYEVDADVATQDSRAFFSPLELPSLAPEHALIVRAALTGVRQ